MGYVTPEQITQARKVDLLSWLQAYEPDNLVRIGGNTYCTKEHDSLKISNGKWHWFSRGIGGRTALDYLIKVQDYSFTQAVEAIAGRAAEIPPISYAHKSETPREFVLPELNDNTDEIKKYLMGRGIHPKIIDYCIDRGLLMETKKYHNAVFAGYDRDGKMRYAALRGTMGDFKGEVDGSDKRYAFSIDGNNATNVHLFESAIDAMSYATLMQHSGRKCDGTLLSLGGVSKWQNTVPIALSQFLQNVSQVKTICLHLDNDETGRNAAVGIIRMLRGKYKVLNEPPSAGKDVNELLQMRLSATRKKEEFER